MDDVLDPDIVRFTPKIGTKDVGPRHENFPPSADPIDAFTVDMVDIDVVQQRASFQVVLKDPGTVPPDGELSAQLRQGSPQFFLRNIKRHVMDHHYPDVPWMTEVWRDRDEYLAFGSQEVLTYQPVQLDSGNDARRIMKQEREKNTAVLRDLDWYDYHGRWKEGLTAESWYEQHGLLHKKSAGRFATGEPSKEIVSNPGHTGFDSTQTQTQTQTQTRPKKEQVAPPDPRFDDLPDDIKKMLGLL